MEIFEKSQRGRYAFAQAPDVDENDVSIDQNLLRQDKPCLPELSELEVVRHFTQLAQKNYCIDTHFYPLGSCTMKYNPKGVQALAMLAPFKNHHPLSPIESNQGFLQCLFELQEYLKIITGMEGVSLSPMAGAQGEWAGVAMIKAYHEKRGDNARREMLVSDAAHGTNPASAKMCGYETKEVPTTEEGDIDLKLLRERVGPRTAGIMLTNPSTLGVFERNITKVAQIVHEAGGLLYYDGANLNAILGKVRPGDMAFDVMHLNLHKTFATPHGGGGPGSGPVLVNAKLKPFLPVPFVEKKETPSGIVYAWLESEDSPLTIGRLSTFMGNAGILLRAYIYIRLLGAKGLQRVAEFATLNANYMMKQLQSSGYTLAFPKRRAAHEFIVTLAKEAHEKGVSALDVAKSLLDFGFYAPTIYFPSLVKESLLIEPTETESKQTLDAMIVAMQKIKKMMQDSPKEMANAPSRLPCKRLDEVKAARELILTWQQEKKD